MKKPLVFVLIIIALIVLARHEMKMGSSDPDSNSVLWNGKQSIKQTDSEVKNIAVPGQSEMLFEVGKTAQKVNIYNPEQNDCAMVFTLKIGDEIIWKSGECLPGYGYYEIELEHSLEPGTYEGNLIHECFRQNTQLNTANISVTIIVK